MASELRTAAAVSRQAASVARHVSRAAAASLTGRYGAGGPPDARRALERYREVCDEYDLRTIAGDPYRDRTVDAMHLRRGEIVLDVGCGTGLNFAPIADAIGPGGRLVGIDVSAGMLAHARRRAAGLLDVTLIEAAAEDADIPVQADVALLCGTHDILRSARALANVVRHVRPGGRVVAGGPKWAPWWQPGAAALNLWTWQMNRHYVTTFEGFERPWSLLAQELPNLAVEEVLFGAGFIATATRDETS